MTEEQRRYLGILIENQLYKSVNQVKKSGAEDKTKEALITEIIKKFCLEYEHVIPGINEDTVKEILNKIEINMNRIPNEIEER